MAVKTNVVATPDQLKRSRKDPIRPWFEASEDLNDFIGIRFGRIAPKASEPEWLYRSHADYDGIGGFTDIIRNRGVRLDSMPNTPHPADPSWWSFLRSVPEYLQPRYRVAWKVPFPLRRPAAIDRPPEAVSWHVFDEADTASIRRQCHASGFTVNSFLLKHLSAAIFPSLVDDTPVMPWMIPVNLRGKVKRDRDTENHSSYVRVLVGKRDSIPEVHSSVYKALAEGVHWANWLAYSTGKLLSSGMRRAMIKAERATSQWVIGAFSNLGVWDQERRFSGRDMDGNWLFMPPAMRFFKIGAGCITYQGRLSLAMHLHPELSVDPDNAWGWMDAWVSLIKKNLA
jgi:hypothetical protein